MISEEMQLSIRIIRNSHSPIFKRRHSAKVKMRKEERVWENKNNKKIGEVGKMKKKEFVLFMDAYIILFILFFVGVSSVA